MKWPKISECIQLSALSNGSSMTCHVQVVSRFIALQAAYILLAKKCPECGSISVAEILYGYVIITPELERDIDAGKITLGGCCISGVDPKWECNDCYHQWGKLKTG